MQGMNELNRQEIKNGKKIQIRIIFLASLAYWRFDFSNIQVN